MNCFDFDKNKSILKTKQKYASSLYLGPEKTHFLVFCLLIFLPSMKFHVLREEQQNILYENKILMKTCGAKQRLDLHELINLFLCAIESIHYYLNKTCILQLCEVYFDEQ